MTGGLIANVPGAEQLLRLCRGILQRRTLLAAPVLVPWAAILEEAVAALDRAIAPRAQAVALPAARAAAQAADREHDRAQRFFYGLLSTFEEAPDAEQVQAATLLRATLYPDKLLVVHAAFADAVAAGPTFAKRLALPEVSAALGRLEGALPGVRAAAAAVVAGAAALGQALDAVDAALASDAGQASSALFALRTQVQQQLAVFTQTVSTVAYPSEAPEDKEARQALIGPYLRYLASGAGTATPPAPAEPPEA